MLPPVHSVLFVQYDGAEDKNELCRIQRHPLWSCIKYSCIWISLYQTQSNNRIQQYMILSHYSSVSMAFCIPQKKIIHEVKNLGQTNFIIKKLIPEISTTLADRVKRPHPTPPPTEQQRLTERVPKSPFYILRRDFIDENHSNIELQSVWVTEHPVSLKCLQVLGLVRSLETESA